MSSSIEDLLETLERLWPESTAVAAAQPRTSRGGQITSTGDSRSTFAATDGADLDGADLDGAADALHLYAIPSIEAPRLLVPSGRRAAANAVRRFSCSVTPREVLERTSLSAALRSVGPAVLFDRIDVLGGSGGVAEHLSEVLGERVTVSVGIGTDRANRKPVLQVFDRRGRPLAHVKVGDTDVAAGHVRGEAQALRQVSEVAWDRVVVPQVLHHGRWNGNEVLVISSLPASPLQFGRRRRFPSRAADEVARSCAGSSMPLASIPAWERWIATTQGISDGERSDRLGSAIERVEERWGDAEVRTGAWHGDFTPWNMAWHSGRLSIWDWERYETGVPAGLDAVHYAVNVAVSESGFKDAAVRAGIDEAARMLGSGTGFSDQGDPMVAAYLIAISTRYLAAAELPGGGVIAASADVMLSQLESVAGSTQRSVA